ncbi:MAG: flagellar transcriptional regulator FlhD [Pseudomonadota bacterium]
MKMDEMLDEMRDVNLSYLMLAQSMIRQDKATAVFRLGISQDVADLIENLTPAQILKLAGSGMLVSRFRFDDGMVLNMLTSYTKDRAMAQSHAAILMAGQSMAAFA